MQKDNVCYYKRWTDASLNWSRIHVNNSEQEYVVFVQGIIKKQDFWAIDTCFVQYFCHFYTRQWSKIPDSPVRVSRWSTYVLTRAVETHFKNLGFLKNLKS